MSFFPIFTLSQVELWGLELPAGANFIKFGKIKFIIMKANFIQSS